MKIKTCLALVALLPAIAGADEYYALSLPGWGTFANYGVPHDHTQLTPALGSSMASGDVDGDGQNELIAAFTTGGVYAYITNSWVLLSAGHAGNGIAVGDINGDGTDEVFLSVTNGAPGVWEVDTVAGTVLQVNPTAADKIATGDLDGDGTDELIMSFSAFGVWVDADGSGSEVTNAWQINAAYADHLDAGDIDGDGNDEVLLSYPGVGVYASQGTLNSGTQLHPTPTDLGLLAADIDGDGDDEVILSWTAHGTYANDGVLNSNTLINAVGAEAMAAGDTDWDGIDELLLSFNVSAVTGVYSNVSGVDTIITDVAALALGVVEVSSVIPPIPEIGDITMEVLTGTNALTLTWATGISLYDYTLQSKSSLEDASWSNEVTMAGTGGDMTVTTGVDEVQSFYRVEGE